MRGAHLALKKLVFSALKIWVHCIHTCLDSCRYFYVSEVYGYVPGIASDRTYSCCNVIPWEVSLESSQCASTVSSRKLNFHNFKVRESQSRVNPTFTACLHFNIRFPVKVVGSARLWILSSRLNFQQLAVWSSLGEWEGGMAKLY